MLLLPLCEGKETKETQNHKAPVLYYTSTAPKAFQCIILLSSRNHKAPQVLAVIRQHVGMGNYGKAIQSLLEILDNELQFSYQDLNT